MKGTLITFEGGEGSGKGTAIKRLRKYLEQEGKQVSVFREPGTSKISEEIRKVIQKPRTPGTKFNPFTELLLFQASRAQFVDELLIPALEKDDVVILDRFYDSSTAYQGYGRGLGPEMVHELNLKAAQGIVPHLTFIFDLPPEIGLRRCQKGEFEDYDRFEQEELDFHNALREGYLDMAKKDSRFKVIDVENNNQEQVFELVKKIAMPVVNSKLQKTFTARKLKN